MSFDNKRLLLLRKLICANYGTEKKILNMTTENMLDFCGSMNEMATILELQKALKNNKVISFLSREPGE